MMSHPHGVACAGCGSVYASASELVHLEQLPTPPRTLAPVPRTTADTGAVLATFEIHQRSQGFSEITITNRINTYRAAEKMIGTPLLELTRDQLIAYLGREGVKAATRRSNQVALRAFFEFATTAGYCTVNPAHDLPTVRVPRGEPRPFSREQIEQLLTSGAYSRTRAMILLGYFQGFRVSSIAAVHGADVDLISKRIRTKVKGGKERIQPLHPVIAALAESMPRDAYWFPARRGADGHIDRTSVSSLILKAKRRAGITDPKLTAHSLRHSFATHLVEDGVNMRVIQKLMMHDSLASTEIYSGVSEPLARAGIEALAAIEVPTKSSRKS